MSKETHLPPLQAESLLTPPAAAGEEILNPRQQAEKECCLQTGRLFSDMLHFMDKQHNLLNNEYRMIQHIQLNTEPGLQLYGEKRAYLKTHLNHLRSNANACIELDIKRTKLEKTSEAHTPIVVPLLAGQLESIHRRLDKWFTDNRSFRDSPIITPPQIERTSLSPGAKKKLREFYYKTTESFAQLHEEYGQLRQSLDNLQNQFRDRLRETPTALPLVFQNMLADTAPGTTGTRHGYQGRIARTPEQLAILNRLRAETAYSETLDEQAQTLMTALDALEHVKLGLPVIRNWKHALSTVIEDNRQHLEDIRTDAAATHLHTDTARASIRPVTAHHRDLRQIAGDPIAPALEALNQTQQTAGRVKAITQFGLTVRSITATLEQALTELAAQDARYQASQSPQR